MMLKKNFLNLVVGFACIAFFILFKTITLISTPTWLVLIISILIISIVNSISYKKISNCLGSAISGGGTITFIIHVTAALEGGAAALTTSVAYIHKKYTMQPQV